MTEAIRLPRAAGSLVASAIAIVADAAATTGLALASDLLTTFAATCLHALAVLLTARAIGIAAGSRSEVLLLAAVAAALPAVGACTGFWFCWSRAPRHASNAHAANDPLLPTVAKAAPDLQHELRINSYTQVVRHGSLEEKRNLLRRLAQLGTPRHLAIVRQFLGENEPELRLCAYAELARIGQRHEHRIGELRRAATAAASGDAAIAQAELAAATRDYATTGALDEEMARYWADQAAAAARAALQIDASCRRAECVLAQVLGDRGELAAAWALVAAWPAEVDAACELARAEIAFRRRDRAACRTALARLELLGAPVPEWLRSVGAIRNDAGNARRAAVAPTLASDANDAVATATASSEVAQ
jgi:hypothetical protein